MDSWLDDYGWEAKETTMDDVLKSLESTPDDTNLSLPNEDNIITFKTTFGDAEAAKKVKKMLH
ncbi:hypothetical protein HK097_004864 [Rhizophlyctis rosea]|uniref:Uncharacterized protein n=1 Tax=Rhizophlyctis rosea TaxID=64517 RepID=A0AAD5X4V9_9FUNG|nr:hypothetical protein HK097_004864 [Rhizophlyctis rosea]